MCRFGAADSAYCAEGSHRQAIHVAATALYNPITSYLCRCDLLEGMRDKLSTSRRRLRIGRSCASGQVMESATHRINLHGRERLHWAQQEVWFAEQLGVQYIIKMCEWGLPRMDCWLFRSEGHMAMVMKG